MRDAFASASPTRAAIRAIGVCSTTQRRERAGAALGVKTPMLLLEIPGEAQNLDGGDAFATALMSKLLRDVSTFGCRSRRASDIRGRRLRDRSFAWADLEQSPRPGSVDATELEWARPRADCARAWLAASVGYR
jgi:hypothetical protein